MNSRAPVYVYRYRVTASSVATVPVGQDLVDKRRDLVKTWTVLDRNTGDLKSFTAKRGGRACSTCFVNGQVSDYEHEGPHAAARPKAPLTAGAVRPAVSGNTSGAVKDGAGSRTGGDH